MQKKYKVFFAIFIFFILISLFFSKISIKNTYAKSNIYLNKENITLYFDGNNSKTLKIIGTNKKVNWKSKNKDIATVDKNGKVIGIKSGETKIIAKVNGKSYTCNVVCKKSYISKTNINLDSLDIAFIKLVGTKIKKITVSNNKILDVEIDEDNSKIIDVFPKKTGNCTITIIGNNNKKYKCKVKVIKAKLNKTDVTNYINDTFKLKLNIGKITKITSSNSKVAKVDNNGNVTSLSPGVTTIKVYSSNEYTYTCKLHVKNSNDTYNGFINQIGSVDKDFLYEIETNYYLVPQKIREYLEKDNWIFNCDSSNLTKKYNYEKEVSGICWYEAKRIDIQNYNSLKSFYYREWYAQTIIHEIGHAIDLGYRNHYFSQTKEFKEIMKNEVKSFYNHFNTFVDENESLSQYYAEAFKSYILNPKKLKKYCPNTYTYLQTTIKSIINEI